VLEVDYLNQLDDKRIEVWFESYYEISINENTYTIGDSVRTSNSGKALIDFEKNKVYDFTGWDIGILHNDIIYAGGFDYTIYKIDINNISTAIPLNNSGYFIIGGIYPKFLFGNKVLGSSYASGSSQYVIDVNNAFPIKNIQDGYITADMCSFIPEPCRIDFYKEETGLILQDFSGDCWFVIFGGKTPGLDRYGYIPPNYGQGDKYFTGKVSIDDEGQISLSDYYEATFSFTPSNDYAMFFMNSADGGMIDSITNPSYYTTKKFIIIYDNGFINISKKINGIQIESTTLPITNTRDLYQGNSFIKDNYLYYLEGSSIKRLYLVSGSSAETIYTNTGLITSGNVYSLLTGIGSDLIFYQFADDNITVNTYSLSMYQPGVEPKLLSTSSVDIQYIVELDF
jgi:hypothetical protein